MIEIENEIENEVVITIAIVSMIVSEIEIEMIDTATETETETETATATVTEIEAAGVAQVIARNDHTRPPMTSMTRSVDVDDDATRERTNQYPMYHHDTNRSLDRTLVLTLQPDPALRFSAFMSVPIDCRLQAAWPLAL